MCLNGHKPYYPTPKMKFKFKIQQYQTEAVENTVAVFSGQPSHTMAQYRIDRGRQQQQQITYEGDDTGYRNHRIELTPQALLQNIHSIQNLYDITPSPTLAKGVGAVNLDIEMETGTGKTYVYIKTMFELNKQYGWSKFIIVVPSIAIREGVAKSFKMLEEHFMEHYGKKARWFIYNSANLQQLDSFASDSGLSVMIINTQAFAASMKEGGKSKESRIIYSKRDEFGSRRPIDVIAANYPIIIMDEPQKMEGDATQAGIKRFNPLFVLNYPNVRLPSLLCRRPFFGAAFFFSGEIPVQNIRSRDRVDRLLSIIPLDPALDLDFSCLHRGKAFVLQNDRKLGGTPKGVHKLLRFDRLNTFRTVKVHGHAANDDPYPPIFCDFRNCFHVCAKGFRTVIGFAGHRVFSKRIGDCNPDSLIADIKGDYTFFHRDIIAHFSPLFNPLKGNFLIFP